MSDVWQSQWMVGAGVASDVAEAEHDRSTLAVARLRAGYGWLDLWQHVLRCAATWEGAG
jgi:hypothetical protein